MKDNLKIIANGYVITCDPQNRGGRYSLLIREGRIVEVADQPDTFQALHPYATVVDASGKLIVPGFINAHFHSESILLRRRTQGQHFALWKRDLRLHEAGQKLTVPQHVDDIRTLVLASYFSHLKSGTTCAGEYPPVVDGKGLVQILQAVERTDVSGVVVLQNWDQIRQARELGPGPRCMIGLGREEDFTVYTFENLLRAAREYGFPICAHVAEQREDVEVVRKNFQKSVIGVLRDYNMLEKTTLLIHLNHATPDDLATVEEAGVSVAIAPRSTAFKQSGYPALRGLLSRNINVCLATDWGSTDMLGEMQFLYNLPLLIHGLRRPSALDILRMGTLNSARALGIGNEAGSIETGKRADLTFFSLSDIRIPRPEPASAATGLATLLLTYLDARDISDVMISGDFYVGNGEIMTIAEEDLCVGIAEMSGRYFPQPGIKKLHEDEERQTQKIFPFIPEPRKVTADVEGFEEGFVVTGKHVENGERKPSPSPPPSTTRDVRQATLPELSKDVKKVFGDDEEF